MKESNGVTYATNLRLNPSSVERFIKIIEGDIAHNMGILNEKLPHFKECETMYLESKKEIDHLNEIIEHDKNILNGLANQRRQQKDGKDIRIVRTTSHLDKPATKSSQARNFKWLDMTKEILAEAKRFMPPYDLYSTIQAKHPIIENYIKRLDSYKRKMMKATYKNNLFRNADPAKTKNRTLASYEGLIGLLDWIDKDGKPKPEYLKSFMYSK